MTDKDKKYVDEAIEKALKSKVPQTVTGIPQDSELQSRLEEVEDRFASLIRSLQVLLPEKDWKGTLSKFYTTIKKKKSQGIGDGVATFLSLLERDGLQEP